MGKHEHKYHLVGWILFLVCAAFFIASAVRSGDLLYLIGSIIFFVACIAFVIPLVSNKRQPVTPDAGRGVERGRPGSAA